MSLASELTEVAREIRGSDRPYPTLEDHVARVCEAERTAGQMVDLAGARRLVRALVACGVIHVSDDAGSIGAA